LTVDEVQERLAGKARDDPNQYPELDPPKYYFRITFST